MAKIRKITDLLPNVQEHIVIRDYTTLRVGGVADYFLIVRSIDVLEMIQLLCALYADALNTEYNQKRIRKLTK